VAAAAAQRRQLRLAGRRRLGPQVGGPAQVALCLQELLARDLALCTLLRLVPLAGAPTRAG